MRFFCLLFCFISVISSSVYGAPSEADDYVLEKRFTAPKGWKWGRFEGPSGYFVRYGHVAPANPKGVIVFQGGHGDFVEQFFETVRYFLYEKKYAVWSMDWAGEGDSKPNPDSDIPGTMPFGKLVDDLSYFFTNIVEKVPNGQSILIGHSMGGNVVLRYAARYSDTFDLFFITSPMVSIRLFGTSLPEWLNSLSLYPMRWIAEAAIALGKKNEFAIFSSGPWRKDLERNFILDHSHTSDYKRGVVPMIYQIREPKLRIGGFTYGTGYELIKTVEFVNKKDFAPSVKGKVVAVGTSKDNSQASSPAEIESFCKDLPDCTFFMIEGSQHAIWLEANVFRNQLLEYLNSFLD